MLLNSAPVLFLALPLNCLNRILLTFAPGTHCFISRTKLASYLLFTRFRRWGALKDESESGLGVDDNAVKECCPVFRQ